MAGALALALLFGKTREGCFALCARLCVVARLVGAKYDLPPLPATVRRAGLYPWRGRDCFKSRSLALTLGGPVIDFTTAMPAIFDHETLAPIKLVPLPGGLSPFQPAIFFPHSGAPRCLPPTVLVATLPRKSLSYCIAGGVPPITGLVCPQFILTPTLSFDPRDARRRLWSSSGVLVQRSPPWLHIRPSFFQCSRALTLSPPRCL